MGALFRSKAGGLLWVDEIEDVAGAQNVTSRTRRSRALSSSWPRARSTRVRGPRRSTRRCTRGKDAIGAVIALLYKCLDDIASGTTVDVGALSVRDLIGETPAHTSQPHRCAAFSLSLLDEALGRTRSGDLCWTPKGGEAEVSERAAHLLFGSGYDEACAPPLFEPLVCDGLALSARAAGESDALGRLCDTNSKMRVRKLMRRLGGFGVWQDSELWCSKGGDGRDVPAVLGSGRAFRERG